MEHNILTAPVGVKMHRSINLELPTLTSPTESIEIRRAKLEDAQEIAELCDRAYIDEIWNKKGTEAELFYDSSVKAVLLATNSQRLVATASLQVHADASHSGQIRWVATKADMRRQGLAKTLVVRLLEIAETEGCKEVFLKTTTDALGAISLYLQLGFKPIVSCENEGLIWDDVHRLIGSKSCS